MIFLDSSYFIELMDEKNRNYRNALKIGEYIADLNESTVINTTVLVETLNRTV